MQRTPPAQRNIGIDLDSRALARFRCDYRVERVHACNNCIRTTRTTTGLRLRAHLVRKQYSKGTTIPDARVRDLPITTDPLLPRWNHVIRPT